MEIPFHLWTTNCFGEADNDVHDSAKMPHEYTLPGALCSVARRCVYNGLWQISENKASAYRDIRRVSVRSQQCSRIRQSSHLEGAVRSTPRHQQRMLQIELLTQLLEAASSLQGASCFLAATPVGDSPNAVPHSACNAFTSFERVSHVTLQGVTERHHVLS